MNIGIRAIVEGRSEMAFWPLLAILYITSITHTLISYAALGLFSIVSGMTYILLRNIAEVVEEAQGRYTTKKRVSRRASKWDQVEESLDLFFDLVPDSTISKVLAYGSLLLWVFLSPIVWLWLHSVSEGFESGFTVLIILLSPLLYLVVLFLRVMWNR